MLEMEKDRNGFQSMSLDSSAEILIAEAMYGTFFTTGGTTYVLVKEIDGTCCLYIWAHL